MRIFVLCRERRVPGGAMRIKTYVSFARDESDEGKEQKDH